MVKDEAYGSSPYGLGKGDRLSYMSCTLMIDNIWERLTRYGR